MPKRKAVDDDEEESAWEEDGELEEEESDDDYDDSEDDRKPAARPTTARKKAPPPAAAVSSSNVADIDDNEDDEPPQKKPAKRRVDTRQKPRKRKTDEPFDNSNTVILPSHARRTQKGGYAHTDAARWKIGRANRGNLPWNKGKLRSESDKSNISKGVKARNRKILLVNLTRCKMTEEEYLQLKKEIKYVRERVRVAKKQNAQQQEALQNMMEQQRLVEEAEKVWKEEEEERLELERQQAAAARKAAKEQAKHQAELERQRREEERRRKAEEAARQAQEEAVASAAATAAQDDDDDDADSKPPAAKKRRRRTRLPDGTLVDPDEVDEYDNWPEPQFVREEIHWTPHPYDYDDDDDDKDTAAEPAAASWQDESNPCPNGGPGGLICCRLCTKQYASFLTSTFQEMEPEKSVKLLEERNEVVQLLRQTKTNLSTTLRAAKRGMPPMPRLKQSEDQQQEQHDANNSTAAVDDADISSLYPSQKKYTTKRGPRTSSAKTYEE